MSLPKFSVRQSLFVNLVSLIIITAGIVVVMGMNREIFPYVTFDMVSIQTAYPGATPTDVEKLITTPVEKELREVDGIKEIRSSSAIGLSLILVQIDPDEGNKQRVINDVRSAVERVKDLPKDIYEDPVVTEVTSRNYPVIEVTLSGDMSEAKLREYADGLEDQLEDVEGVARINKSGYRDREIQVRVDPDRMREYYVSFDEIEEALASRNISVPAGKIDTDSAEYSVRTTGEFSTAGEVENIIIRANTSGNWIRVKDIAEVADSFKSEDVINKTFGTRSINLVVMKRESVDALRLVDEVKEISRRFLENCPDGLKMAFINDYSFFAKRRLDVLKNNGWVSLVIVVLVLLLFLQWRVAFMTAIGIPFAFLATFIVMQAMGITVNLISMFGLVMVLGMIVDDAIVISENVYRHMEEGVPPREAAVRGSEEVLVPVVSAVLTTVAAFAPLLFMEGIIGKFIKQLPTVVIIALLASLLEALIILPSHMADFVRVKRRAREGQRGIRPWFNAVAAAYTRVITWSIRGKYAVVAGFMVLLALAGFLAFYRMDFVLFPAAGVNMFFIRGEAPIGTPVGKTDELMAPVEKIVSGLPKNELESFVTTVGLMARDRNDPFTRQSSELAQISVYLTPEQDRKRDVREIMAEVRQKTKDIKGFADLRFDEPESGPPVGKAVEARIRGEDYDTLDRIAAEYMEFLRTIEGTADVTWDHKPGKEEIRVRVDNEKAAMSGLNVAQIARTVRAVFEGSIATAIKPVKAEEETDVTVTFADEVSGNIGIFENVLVRNNAGKLVPLRKVATIEKVPGTTTIYHLDGKRSVTASCNVDDERTTSMKVNRVLEKTFADLPQRYMGYSVKYGGEKEETAESVKSLWRAFLYAFLIIYLMLASTFRSIIQPAMVMLAIPFGLVGVVLAFFLHGMPFSFMALLGIVGLSGIVVNDSIVLVDFINNLRRQGVEKSQSIVRAGQLRLRAVLLTTITTVGGLCTVAYGIGGKDPFLVPMALAICWGLSLGTLLTLIVLPCVYSIGDDVASGFRRVMRRDARPKIKDEGMTP